MTNVIKDKWLDIERQGGLSGKKLNKMVCIDYLFRVYIGVSGIPSKRFVSLEIPASEVYQFESFIVPQGFTLSIENPEIKHDGYVSCVLQATNSEQNDVFTIVTEDILMKLKELKDTKSYVCILKQRIEKWKNFFSNPKRSILTEKQIIGLFGELSLIKLLLERNVNIITRLWNGPLKLSQDFQSQNTAIEVKTIASYDTNYIHISSEVQLDLLERQSLFLVAFYIEKNESDGITLPQLIKQIMLLIDSCETNRFLAKLICLGYNDKQKDLYNKKYYINKKVIYSVENGFPRILKKDLHKGVTGVKYTISLDSCAEFKVDIEEIIKTLKEDEYGEE